MELTNRKLRLQTCAPCALAATKANRGLAETMPNAYVLLFLLLYVD